MELCRYPLWRCLHPPSLLHQSRALRMHHVPPDLSRQNDNLQSSGGHFRHMVVLHPHGCAKTNTVVGASAIVRNPRECVLLLHSPDDHAGLLHGDLQGRASSDQEDDTDGPWKPEAFPSLQRTQGRQDSWCSDRSICHLLGPFLRLKSHLRPVQKLLTTPQRVSSCRKVVALRQQRAQSDHLRLHEQRFPVSVQETSRVFVLFPAGCSAARYDFGKVVF